MTPRRGKITTKRSMPHSKANDELEYESDFSDFDEIKPVKQKRKLAVGIGDLSPFETALARLDTKYIPNGHPIARDNEMKTLVGLWSRWKTQGEDMTRAVYISGQPGSGKTLCVSRLSQGAKEEGVIVRSMNAKKLGSNQLAVVRTFITAESKSKSGISVLCIVDEADHLKPETSQLLFNPPLNVAVIGIGNNVRFDDRIPERIAFHTYKKDEVIQILEQRVGALTFRDHPIFEHTALIKCATHVTKNKGDMRVALSLCNEALKIVMEKVMEEEFVKENSAGNGWVTIKDMHAAGVAVDSKTRNALLHMTLLQKILLKAFVDVQKQGRARDTDLTSSYRQLCDRYKLSRDEPSDVYNALGVIDSSLLRCEIGKRGRDKGVKFYMSLINVDDIVGVMSTPIQYPSNFIRRRRSMEKIRI